MVFSNVIVDVTVPRRSSVFSQSSVQISAGLSDISDLACEQAHLIVKGGGAAIASRRSRREEWGEDSSPHSSRRLRRLSVAAPPPLPIK